MNLNECRNKIDEIDAQMLKLFCERLDVVGDIAKYKEKNNLPILNKERETAVILDKISKAPSELKSYVSAYFTNLMEISKCLQINILSHDDDIDKAPENSNIDVSSCTRVVCQGAMGAYQHSMATKLFPNSEITFCGSYDEVFDAVKYNSADFGVVPLENSTAGTVNDVYDLLSSYKLYIVAMQKLHIEHCIAAKTASNGFPNVVYSYVQALNQCSDFLKEHSLEPRGYPNTALAAKFVSESDDDIAAICSEDCAALYGLKILAKSIQNIRDNYTRFIVISRDNLTNPNCNEISVCVKIPNLQGELNKLLSKFSLYNIDMTKLESRPIGGENFNALFYLSFSGNLADKNVVDLIHDLKYNYSFLKLLGTYEKN